MNKYEVSRLAATILNETTDLTLSDDVSTTARRKLSQLFKKNPPETIAQLQEAVKSTIPGAFELFPDLFNRK